MSNFKHLGLGLYKLKNQNGLKGLIKSMSDEPDKYFENYQLALARCCSKYPENYPCIVSLSDACGGFHYPNIKVYSSAQLKDFITTLQREGL
jgi:hypothetical protein